MSYRRTLVFLVVFAALGGFFYVYEIKGGEARKEAEENARRVVSFKPEEVTTITIARPHEHIVIKKESDMWSIVEPVSSPAETRKVEQLVETMARLEFERDLGEQPELEAFGLAGAETVKIQASGDNGELGGVLLGSTTPDGKNFYVKTEGGGNVYTSALSSRAQLDQDLFAIRDKRVLQFLPPDVTAVSIYRDSQSLAMEKETEDEWVITAPEVYDADKEKIGGLLNSLTSERVVNFVEENASDLEPYGLEKPVARVELRLGERQAAVSFGRKLNPDAELICAAADDNRVVEVNESVLEKVTAVPNEWRDRRLTKLDAVDVIKVAIESPEVRLTLEQDDSGDWMLLEPEKARADSDKIESLLRRITRSRLSGFAEGAAVEQARRRLENPQLRLRLWKEQEEQPVVLSFAPAESGNEWFAALQSQSIGLINEGVVREFSGEPDDYRDKSVVSFKAADIEKIEFVKDSTTYLVKRKDIQWDIPRNLEMEDFEIGQMLWNLGQLKYINKKVKDSPDSAYGFDSPQFQVHLYEAEGKHARKLVFGKEASGPNTVYVQGDDAGIVMEADGEFLTEFIEKF